jgi:prepilin-type processing-associated H-X9-DG protein
MLAAILFLVFAKVREKARQASCLSNLKQLGVAEMTYVQDYDECYQIQPYIASIAVPGAGGAADGSNVNWWRFPLMPYIKNWQILKCPSGRAVEGDPSYAGTQMVGQYGINGTVVGTASCVRMSQLTAPAAVLLIGDSVHWYASQYWTAYAGCAADGYFNAAPTGTPAMATDDHSRHNGGSNLNFCDGHAKWMKNTDIVGHWTQLQGP